MRRPGDSEGSFNMLVDTRKTPDNLSVVRCLSQVLNLLLARTY